MIITLRGAMMQILKTFSSRHTSPILHKQTEFTFKRLSSKTPTALGLDLNLCVLTCLLYHIDRKTVKNS